MFRVTNLYVFLQRTEEAAINKDKCSDLFGNSQFLTALQLCCHTERQLRTVPGAARA